VLQWAAFGKKLGEAVDILYPVDKNRTHTQLQCRYEVHVQSIAYRYAEAGFEAQHARSLNKGLRRGLAGQGIVQADKNGESRAYSKSVEAFFAD
jgi:hypothetical protein